MIKIEKDKVLLLPETLKTIKNMKANGLYCFLMSYQQEKIYFETINEIVEHFKKNCYKTIQKCLKELIKEGLVIKKYGIYFINPIPLKER